MGRGDQAVETVLTEERAPGEAPALAVEGLTHDFGTKRALDDVALKIRPGEFTVLLGLNGAGKTTLFSLITRLYNNRTGSIRIFDFDVRRQPTEALKRIGVVFQQPTLDLDLTVSQNLYYQAALHGLGRRQARARVETELDRCKLRDRGGDKIRELSSGQRRRVEIARALLHDPSLLLLDEPTVGLDIGSRQAIIDHVRRLCREERLAVLWATHLIDEVAEDNRVVVLHEGRVLASGNVAEVNRWVGAGSIREAYTTLIGVAP